MKWRTVQINAAQGPVRAVAPEIIAASRATDIPAFYAQWFMNRLRAGYARWVNPFNGRPQYVAFDHLRVVVFWSKNPLPLLPLLPQVEARELAWYLEFTLNDYEAEGWEPNLPPLARRIDTFRRFADAAGPERVVWRFDPLMLAGALAQNPNACDVLLERMTRIGRALQGYTRKLVFSFADIADYRKVAENLRRAGLGWRDFTQDEMHTIASGVARLAAEMGVEPCTCGERGDLSAFGISHNRCTDPELILNMTRRHPDILRLFGIAPQQLGLPLAMPRGAHPASQPHEYPRDPGQRAVCLCVPCKDVGQYDTCPHGCVYCYANTSPATAARNFRQHDPAGESIVAEL